MKFKYSLFILVLLVIICCIGAASAADDVADVNLTSTEDVVVEQANDAESTLEVNTDENEVLSATGTATVSTWSDLKTYSQKTDKDYTITVANGNYNVGSDKITFGNNVKIVGSGNTVITGGDSSVIPFNGNGKSIIFSNIIFRDMNSDMVIQLTGDHSSKIENCVFENIKTSTSGQKSVVFNNGGYLKVINTNFTNCNTTYGVITNHKTPTTALMEVENCKFEYNNAVYEPGAINNCGIMNVTNSIFNYNHAGWWAGAIHTHANAKSVIKKSSFTGNTAGWNGGALYTYATLEVYDSNFTNNNCSTNAGGGAIGASNYFFASTAYNVYVSNCRFTDNNNLAANGNGGAIAAMNGGNLTVIGSTFNHNSADNGQAICGFNTNEYANISEGEAHLVIQNNMFLNHNIKTGTTVKLSGLYTFNENTFINSPQIAYNSNNNYYGLIITQNNQNKPLSTKNQDILGNAYLDELSESETVINPSDLFVVSRDCENNAIIIVRKGTITRLNTFTEPKNITIIGEDRENTFVDTGMDLSEYGMGIIKQPYAMSGLGESVNKNGLITWVNITFICQGIKLSDTNYNFINCTFINVPIEFGEYRESNSVDPTSMDVYNYAFENCDFVNYTQTVIVGHKFSNVVVSNCNFDNVTADSIISTNGNRTDDSGRKAGVTIKDSTFKEASIKGIVKTTDASNVIADNKYDFATLNTATIEDNVYVDAPATATSLTVKVSDIKEGENFTIDVALSNNLNANVSVVINNQKYNVSVVNGTGSLNVSDKLAPNTYDVEAKYAGEYPYAASTNTTTFKVEKVIINTALSATKVSATYNVAKNLVITLTDANGNALVGKYVSVKVGTISKNIKTDKNGKVSVNVATLVPKNSYTATITFAGDNDYNVSSTTAKVVVAKATPKLTTKKLTTKVKVKTKKVTATLKDNKGKVLKNTKVTLKIKGKTYTAKTNKKGVATFKVTKLNKKGTFKGTVKFAGNKYFKAISKKVTVVVKK